MISTTFAATEGLFLSACKEPWVDDEVQEVLSGISRLPPHEQAVLGLRYFDGFSVKEIAAMTDRSVGTVTKQISRALTRLRRVLGVETGSGSHEHF